MAATRPGQATQLEVLITQDVGKKPVGSPVRHFKCSRCIIIYSKAFGPNDTKFEAECPLCTQELKTEQMRLALQNTNSKVELLERQNADLDGAVNLQRSFKDAMDLLDSNDLVFLKTVMYQWRRDRAVQLKIIHSDGKPTGFIADYRHAEPEGHTCTSIGGGAIAAYYEEALRTVGSAQAMQILLRAAQHLLPGATQ